MKRLEKKLGININIGDLFNLVVGTSAGKQFIRHSTPSVIVTHIGGIITLGIGVNG